MMGLAINWENELALRFFYEMERSGPNLMPLLLLKLLLHVIIWYDSNNGV